MTIRTLHLITPEIRKKVSQFQHGTFTSAMPEITAMWQMMATHSPGSFNWESMLRAECREEEARRIAYATAGERFIGAHYFSPCIATHTDQTRYFDEHYGNERWLGIDIGARKIQMMHDGAKAQNKTPFTVIGCDIPLLVNSAVFYVGVKRALANDWKVVLATLPEWRDGRSRAQVIEDALRVFCEAGFKESDLYGVLAHPDDAPSA